MNAVATSIVDNLFAIEVRGATDDRLKSSTNNDWASKNLGSVSNKFDFLGSIEAHLD